MLDDSACYSYEELDGYMSAWVHTKVNIEGREDKLVKPLVVLLILIICLF